ncbi:hypothetical protein IFM89_021203 [Coptis chinensis]|uniref:Uncharacterized protein n=1 Tax=Coptis chinensis TaxID=261450 RepID=A0A835LSB4_9MAGN|nr:hypothetical protein IFM89_021203 [Coptis chinensis]
MEGVIPSVYRAIVRYKSSKHGSIARSWSTQSPSSASYMRLGDSGRIQASEVQLLLRNDIVFNPSSSSKTTTNNAISVTQSPLRFANPRRFVTCFNG